MYEENTRTDEVCVKTLPDSTSKSI